MKKIGLGGKGHGAMCVEVMQTKVMAIWQWKQLWPLFSSHP